MKVRPKLPDVWKHKSFTRPGRGGRWAPAWYRLTIKQLRDQDAQKTDVKVDPDLSTEPRETVQDP